LSTLLWFGSFNYRTLECLLWSKKFKDVSSNRGFRCFSSYRPRISKAKVLIFSWNFSQALFMSSLLFKFSKIALNLLTVMKQIYKLSCSWLSNLVPSSVGK
jgi:hypothetical protein